MSSPDRIPDEVEIAFSVLTETVIGQHPNADLALLRRIFEIVERCYHRELRKTGSPSFCTPVGGHLRRHVGTADAMRVREQQVRQRYRWRSEN
jgi:hypothetical protein